MVTNTTPFKALLETKAADLQRIIHDLREEAAGADQEEEGFTELEESAANLEEMQLENSVLAREVRLLYEVRTALQRIAKGTYGICAVCKRPISEERLQALPWASLCLQDQELLEHQRIGTTSRAW